MVIDHQSIKNTLANLEADWKLREEYLNQILKGLSTDSEQKYFFEFISSIPDCIAVQFSDLRSGIVNLASQVTTNFAKLSGKYPEELSTRFSDQFLQEVAFFKALGCGNKVIAKHAHNAIHSLTTNNCLTLETLKKLFNSQKNNKIISIRENVAETFSLFISSMTNPLKKPISSMFYIQGGHDSSGFVGSDTLIDQNLNKNKEINDQSDANMDQNKPNSSKKVEMGDDIYLVTQKIKEENFDLLKNACEMFLKDSSPNVRNSGKEIKVNLSKIQELFLSGQETNVSQFSNDQLDEMELCDKFAESASTKMIIETNFGADQASKNQPFHSKQSLSKIISIEDKIMKVLQNDTKMAKDQHEELEKIILSTNLLLCFSFEQYCQVMNNFHAAKNISLKTTLTRILTKSDLANFQFEILDLILREKLNKRNNYNQVCKYIFDKVSFEVALSMFIVKPYEDLVVLLNKYYCPKKFNKILQKNEIEPQEIVRAIQRSYFRTDLGDGNIGVQNRVNLIQFLQKVMSDSTNRIFFNNVDWRENFVQELKTHNIEGIFSENDCLDDKLIDFVKLVEILNLNISEEDFVAQLNDYIGNSLENQFKLQVIFNIVNMLKNKTQSTENFDEMVHFEKICRDILYLTNNTNGKFLNLVFLQVYSVCSCQSLNEMFIRDLLTIILGITKQTRFKGSKLFYKNLFHLMCLKPIIMNGYLQMFLKEDLNEKIHQMLETIFELSLNLKSSPKFIEFQLQINQNFDILSVILRNQILSNDNLDIRFLGVRFISELKSLVDSQKFMEFNESLTFEQKNLIQIYS